MDFLTWAFASSTLGLAIGAGLRGWMWRREYAEMLRRLSGLRRRNLALEARLTGYRNTVASDLARYSDLLGVDQVDAADGQAELDTGAAGGQDAAGGA